MLRLNLLGLLLAVILVACGPSTAPASTEEPVTPTSEPYPQPTVFVPTAYPGPDDPVTSPSGGAGNPYPSPLDPQPGDETLQRGEAFIDSTDILTLESFPPQFNLILVGNKPTPCHQLRVDVQVPDEQGRILIEAYTVVNPDDICVQVLEPFEETISLRSFPAGEYTVLVNGEQVGEISAP